MEQSQSQAQAYESQQQSQSQSVRRFWRPAALTGLAFGLVGFYEPAKDIYTKILDPDYQEVESVALAKQQQRLQQKNLVCAINMTRQAISGEHETTIRYGVCDNHDVLVEVYPLNKPAFQQWMSPENILSGTAPARTGGLFSSAMAATLIRSPTADAVIQPAQMQLKTLCQKWQDSARQVKMIRVTNEGGTCYRERINVLSGRVEIREQVPCDTQCDAGAQKVE
jgi:hypothetical protein